MVSGLPEGPGSSPLLVRNIRRRPRGVRRPPEIPFHAFSAVLASLKAHGVPQRIDGSVISHFRPGVAPEVAPSLRFLGLIDEGGAPTERLDDLVRAHGTPRWPDVFREVLTVAYAPVFGLPLDRVTTRELHEGFREAYPQTGPDGRRKAVAFFVRAAMAAEVRVSERVVRRRRGASRPAAPEPSLSERDAAQFLIDLLDPETMSDEEQKAVITLLLYLQER